MNQLRNIHLSDPTYRLLKIHQIKALKRLILLHHLRFNQLNLHLYHPPQVPYLYFPLNNQFHFAIYRSRFQPIVITYLTAIDLRF